MTKLDRNDCIRECCEIMGFGRYQWSEPHTQETTYSDPAGGVCLKVIKTFVDHVDTWTGEVDYRARVNVDVESPNGCYTAGECEQVRQWIISGCQSPIPAFLLEGLQRSGGQA